MGLRLEHSWRGLFPWMSGSAPSSGIIWSDTLAHPEAWTGDRIGREQSYLRERFAANTSAAHWQFAAGGLETALRTVPAGGNIAADLNDGKFGVGTFKNELINTGLWFGPLALLRPARGITPGIVGTNVARTADFAPNALARGGSRVDSAYLGKLSGYLSRRGVILEAGSTRLPPGKAGGFITTPEGQAYLLTRSSHPTRQLIWHELGHFRHWRKVGNEAFRGLPRPHAPEQFVFDMLENPHRWYQLTESYRIRAAQYIERAGGFR